MIGLGGFSQMYKAIRTWDGPSAGLLDTTHWLLYGKSSTFGSKALARLPCITIAATAAIESLVQGIRTAAYAIGLGARRVVWIALVVTSLAIGASLGLTSGALWLAVGNGNGLSPELWIVSLAVNTLSFLRDPRLFIDNMMNWVSLNINQFLFAKQMVGVALDLDEKLEQYFTVKRVAAHASKCQRLAMLSLIATLYGAWDPNQVVDAGSELQLGPSPPKGALHKIKRMIKRQTNKLSERTQQAIGSVMSSPVFIVSMVIGSYMYFEYHSNLPATPRSKSVLSVVLDRFIYRIRRALTRVDLHLVEAWRRSLSQ